jgi:four helix bundle protein
MKFVQDYEELDVYLLCCELQNDIFVVSITFPKEEKYSLTDQIRRSSRSIGAQIAEAWARRNYERHFVSKLTDGIGEQLETQHWIKTAIDCKYITLETRNQLRKKCDSIGRMLNSMILKSKYFCKVGKHSR